VVREHAYVFGLDTWYDAKGQIVFTCSKGLTGVGLDRPEWNALRGEPVKPGQKVKVYGPEKEFRNPGEGLIREGVKFTEERKYEEGRKDERYRFYKQELMKKTYNELRYLFEKLKSQGFLENVAYDENLKNGYKDTDSGGSGYINARALNEVLE